MLTFRDNIRFFTIEYNKMTKKKNTELTVVAVNPVCSENYNGNQKPIHSAHRRNPKCVQHLQVRPRFLVDNLFSGRRKKSHTTNRGLRSESKFIFFIKIVFLKMLKITMRAWNSPLPRPTRSSKIYSGYVTVAYYY